MPLNCIKRGSHKLSRLVILRIYREKIYQKVIGFFLAVSLAKIYHLPETLSKK